MEREVFGAGVRPGSPTTLDEIKILVCYILSNLGAAMNFSELHECLLENELVNYFELVTAVDSLITTGHITATTTEVGFDEYSLTDLGKDTAASVDTLVPKSVRDKAVNSAKKLIKQKSRLREVNIATTAVAGGFEVTLAIPNGDSRLVSFSVFCPTKEEASLVKKRFLNDPMYIYKGTLALVTGDIDVIEDIFPTKEQLF